jgi:glutaredoxin
MGNGKRVTLYTTGACKWCRVAKAYLADNEIDFVEVDIIRDTDGRREMVMMTGQYGVPVLRVGEKAMVGWCEAEFRRLYELRPKRRA